MEQKTLRKFLSFGNVLALIITLGINALANIIPIGGNTTGEVSGQYPSLFTPAGITFSIWGLIYLLLLLFAVYQTLCSFKQKEVSFVKKIGGWFIGASAANCLWIIAWHNEQILLSWFLIIALLVSLIGIYLSLNIGNSFKNAPERYFVHLPFSIYLGWASVATIANTVILFIHQGWQFFGLTDVFWTVVLLVITILLGLFVMLKRNDIYFALVIDWALIGILIKHLSMQGDLLYPIAGTTVTGLVLITAGIVMQIFRGKVY